MEKDDDTMVVDGGSTLTSKEVFIWANSNNQGLLHVDDIHRTSKFYICTLCSMWLGAEDMVESASDGDMASYDVEACMRVNLLLLNEQMWEARSK
uniref:Uncharacterized protein n=1 Tax=Oryza nivara TaxID=4536 RepID=A0A0E0GNT2_ORYNI